MLKVVNNGLNDLINGYQWNMWDRGRYGVDYNRLMTVNEDSCIMCVNMIRTGKHPTDVQ